AETLIAAGSWAERPSGSRTMRSSGAPRASGTSTLAVAKVDPRTWTLVAVAPRLGPRRSTCAPGTKSRPLIARIARAREGRFDAIDSEQGTAESGGPTADLERVHRALRVPHRDERQDEVRRDLAGARAR